VGGATPAGGSPGTGGATPSGGHSGASGAAGAAGAIGAGGAAGAGGSPGTGGATPTGGHAGTSGAAGAGGLGGGAAIGGAGGKAGAGGASGSCCGCLCRDPSWSCSADTCVDPSDHAIGLGPEAGFFEIDGGSYVAESQARTSPTHRIWYSFQPATATPESKPLAVFFNGGPGTSTSAYLFAFNTAPWTLDPAAVGAQEIVADPTSWASFANLLYIDAPGTGFSYPLALADGTQPSVGIDLDRDAADVIRVVVRFLDRHPALQSGPVVIVGESYGGTRSTLMLDRLLNYQELATTGAVYQDAGLQADLLSHFAAVYPGTAAESVTPTQIASQFGHQVLIEPVVAGSNQWDINTPDTSVCVPNYEPYQCDEPDGWDNQVTTAAGNSLVTLATMKQALGVDPTTIAWMHASARTNAYGRSPSLGLAAPDLVATFGTLNSNDTYFILLNTLVENGYSSTSRYWMDPSIGISFLDDVVYVDTFITNARLDMVVWAPAIPTALEDYTNIVTGVTVDMTPQTGFDRPGWIEVAYQAGLAPPLGTREIRFPSYTTGGHSVSMKAPAPLLADVTQWYGQTASASVAHLPSSFEVAPAIRPPVTPAATTPQPRPFLGP
jgi:hypothetical protein